ncbi:tyrosine-protein phosphatase [Actinopolymorpha alba]|uniref:tyrosine-protein phosphatase n=1 Tax=Actinopolymorpha alba TaxID=533267 RepID=UPI00036B3BE7|nr:tyrosine-protein phosphatase [Actinopolymorpha alba]
MTGSEQLDWLPIHLDWPNCLNARDVGGMPTADGGTIRTGALVRTDHHGKLNADGIAALEAYGVSRIIDLRRERECERKPSPFASTDHYQNIPVQNPADSDNETLTLAEIYMTMLDTRPKLFASAVAAIADAPAGAVVVHCAGGKDRTGMVVAMALYLAGVSPAMIAYDYSLTEQRLVDESAEYLLGVTDPEQREIVRRLQPTPATNMLATLDHLQNRHGGVSAYLQAGGLAQEQVDALRERLRDS